MKYFGTDGIRGKAYTKLNAELAYKIGQAISTVMKQPKMVIGYDTRESSPMLAYSAVLGAINAGVDVLFMDVVSTPVVAHYSFSHRIPGIMITASHNPHHDNGIKIFHNGHKTSEEIESSIENFIDNGELLYADKKGQFIFLEDASKEYESLYSSFNFDNFNIKIGYDSANGANYKIARKIINGFFPDAMQINNAPNGKNINENCGSTHMEVIKEFVLKNNLDIGFSFDGDGDRILMVDKNGKLYDGDQLIYLIGKYLKMRNKLSKDSLVLTKMSNPAIIELLKQNSVRVSLVDVGDKHVFAEMNKKGYILGGENSGHVIMRDLLHTGDGLLVAIRVLQILKDMQSSLEELTSDLVLYPQRMVNIEGIDKSVLENKIVKKCIEDSKKSLGDNSLLLVRASGTEPLVRVTVSHKNETLMNQVIENIVNTIKNV